MSKKNQEAKLKAESCVSVMEEEISGLKLALKELQKGISSESSMVKLQEENNILKAMLAERKESVQTITEAEDSKDERIERLEYELAQKNSIISRHQDEKEKMEVSLNTMTLINKQYTKEIKRLSFVSLPVSVSSMSKKFEGKE